MKAKVLMNVDWHTGIPDGEEKISFTLDEFDIDDKELCMQKAKERLIEYGVQEETIKQEEWYSDAFHIVCEIGRFDKTSSNPIFLFAKECDVKVKFSYVLAIGKRIFKLEEAEVDVLL